MFLWCVLFLCMLGWFDVVVLDMMFVEMFKEFWDDYVEEVFEIVMVLLCYDCVYIVLDIFDGKLF